MPIFSGDIEKRNGRVVSGTPVDGAELRMPYRMANSFRQGKIQYDYSHKDEITGEAVYKRVPITEITAEPQAAAVDEPQLETGATNTENPVSSIPRSQLPSGAVLDEDLINRIKDDAGQYYRLWKRDVKCEGKYIYIPITK